MIETIRCSGCGTSDLTKHGSACSVYQTALEAKCDVLKAEFVRLSGKTQFCMQCESYAKERDDWKQLAERLACDMRYVKENGCGGENKIFLRESLASYDAAIQRGKAQ